MVSPATSRRQSSIITLHNSVHNASEWVLSCSPRSSACTWSRVGTVPDVGDILIDSQFGAEEARENEMVANAVKVVLLNRQPMLKHRLAAAHYTLVILGSSAAPRQSRGRP